MMIYCGARGFDRNDKVVSASFVVRSIDAK